MPPAKLKPSEVAAEAKRMYIPYIDYYYHREHPAHSRLVSESSLLQLRTGRDCWLRVVVMEGDPVDVALQWYEHDLIEKRTVHGLDFEKKPIPVVNMANEKRPGGDWESGLMAPEECLCRRSNLAHALPRPFPENENAVHYPIPQRGGIYSPHVGRS
jgi:hypothetical protein